MLRAKNSAYAPKTHSTWKATPGLEERNLCCFPALFQSEAGSYLGSQADLGVPSDPGTQGAHLLPPPDTDSSF